MDENPITMSKGLSAVIPKDNDGYCTVYKMDCADGLGLMTVYQVYPGIQLIYNDFEATGCYWDGNIDKSTHNRRERPVYGHRGGSRGRFYYRITTFEERPWDARDPH